jgi:hypothetical protein
VSDVEDDGTSRLSSDFVLRIVSLLDAEHEEQLKGLLKETYPGTDDEAVSSAQALLVQALLTRSR